MYGQLESWAEKQQQHKTIIYEHKAEKDLNVIHSKVRTFDNFTIGLLTGNLTWTRSDSRKKDKDGTDNGDFVKKKDLCIVTCVLTMFI